MPDPKTESSLGDADITTAALLTGVGRSAIAVIAVAGPTAAQVLQQCFNAATRRDLAVGQVRYGNWHGNPQRESFSGGDSRENMDRDATVIDAVESVVMVPVSDNAFEIHCHGGVAATQRILNDLQNHDVNIVDWQSVLWKPDKPLLIREAQEVLSRCLTARTAATAMDQVRGALVKWCHKNLADQATFERIRAEAREILGFASLGLSLNDRFSVVLAGRPNVGKSSLINAIVGYDRSITLDHPGTTRDVLHAETVIDGWPIQLSDTAGIRVGEGEIEREGIRKANQAASQADLVIWVTTPQQRELPSLQLTEVASSPATIRVLNKSDLAENTTESEAVWKTVATTGQGVPELMAQISRKLVPRVPSSMAPVPVNLRQHACLEKLVIATDRQSQQKAIGDLLGANP